MDPDVVAGRVLEGTALDLGVVAGRVGSGRCCWKGIGRDVGSRWGLEGALLLEGLEGTLDPDVVDGRVGSGR